MNSLSNFKTRMNRPYAWYLLVILFYILLIFSAYALARFMLSFIQAPKP